MNMPFVETAKITSKGQVTIPKDVRQHLNLSVGDKISFICEKDRVIIENPIIYAMRKIQKEMAGELEKVGLCGDDDIVKLIMEMRREESEK